MGGLSNIRQRIAVSSIAQYMPRGAGALFFIQMFATLSYSVLYSTLVLYITKHLGLSDKAATSITATFVAFNYALHLIGGYSGGRLLSYRSLFALGMSFEVIGCLLFSITHVGTLYWGLAFFLTGAGLNVTCLNCMLTQLFSPEDKRREGAFLWNYSGMNIGFFVGFMVSGYYQLSDNYHALFVFSSIGNLLALTLCLFNWKVLRDIDTRLTSMGKSDRMFAHAIGVAILVVMVPVLKWLLQNANLSNQVITAMGVIMGLVVLYFAATQAKQANRNKLFAYLILAIMSLVFWALYQLAPMGLTLFVERNVDRHFMGLFIAPQWVQMINTVIIILGGPLLMVVFKNLRARGFNLTIPLQFAIALLLIGIGFAILPLGIHFANAQGYTNFNWIIASYILQSSGELFISPIGYAMIGQLVPPRLQGMMMGTWMMVSGVAATLSNYFSHMAIGHAASKSPLVTNASYSHTFSLLGWVAIACGFLMFLMVPFLTRLTQEAREDSSIDSDVSAAEETGSVVATA